MERNLHFRVETLIPIYDPQIKEIFKTLLQIQLQDNVKARSLDYGKVNEYKTSDYDLAVRSQVETYYYIKRMTETFYAKKTEEKKKSRAPKSQSNN